MWWMYITLALSLTSHAQESVPDYEGVKDYCERAVFNPTCPPDHVILMMSAVYGRMREGQCITGNYGTIGCSANVMKLYDKSCSGRPSCERVVATSVTDEMAPCPKDLRSYLEAEYTCVPVMTATKQECNIYSKVTVTQPTGYLSSYVTQSSTIGSLECPWVLEMQPGQRIRIVLLDFFDNAERGSTTICHVYAIIKDPDSTQRTETVCAGKDRLKEVYVSASNKVEVRLVVKRPEDNGYFLFKYEALGCGDLPQPRHGYFKRKGNKAEIGCNSSGEKWTLQCDKNQWKGTYRNCTSDELIVTGGAPAPQGIFPSGLSIFVIICIAIGVGLVILITGLICIKRSLCIKNSRGYKPEATSELYQPYNESRDGAHVQTGRHPKSGEMLDYGYHSQAENDYFRTWQLRHGGAGIQPGVHGYTGQIPPPPPPPSYPAEQTVYNARYVEHVYESPKFERKSMESNLNGDDVSTGHAKYYELDPQLGVCSAHHQGTSHAQNSQSQVVRQPGWTGGYKDSGNLSY